MEYFNCPYDGTFQWQDLFKADPAKTTEHWGRVTGEKPWVYSQWGVSCSPFQKSEQTWIKIIREIVSENSGPFVIQSQSVMWYLGIYFYLSCLLRSIQWFTSQMSAGGLLVAKSHL